MRKLEPKLPPHWKQVLLRDDRSWLESLSENAYDLKNIENSTNPIPLLMDIVTSVEYQSHSSFGGGTPIESVKSLAEKFWLYLVESQSLESLRNQWRQDNVGPWSLQFYFLRRLPAFLHRGKSHFISTDTPDSQEFLGVLEKSLLEAFQRMTETLPLKNHTRLIYQLHMEGLVDSEISTLIGVTKLQVKKSLSYAKLKLKGELQ
jgi:hypothetical protein